LGITVTVVGVILACVAPGARAATRLVTICGAQRAVTVVADGTPLSLRRPAGMSSPVEALARCDGGSWRPVTTIGLVAGRRKRLVLETGDYRIKVRGRATAYARVGVGEIAHLQVRFSVVNRNDSKSLCPADNKAYTVAGTIVGPRASLAADAKRSITVYMHGLAYGKWLFEFDAVPGYGFQTEMARMGHVSLAYDLLGYGDSGKPANGLLSCFGSDASVAHQIVQQLRAGSYDVDGARRAVSFPRVAIAGQQGAGASAQDEAYSFHDVDALVLIGFADRGVTTAAALAFGQTGTSCATGGAAASGAPGSSGYAYYADFASQLYDAEPAVVVAATKLRSLDPCGRAVSAPLSLVADSAFTSTIDIPVLLAYGHDDVLFNDGPIGTTAQQREMYGGSPDVSLMYWNDTGTAFTLGRSAPAVRRQLGGWLSKHGF
jgi:hypothetical protein